GHAMIAPLTHTAVLEQLSEPVLSALMLRLRDVQRILLSALNAQGFNIGLNLGRCAGAGLPDHVHWHIVPRWAGDTNFMPVIGDAHVIPQAMEEVAKRYREAAATLGLS